MKDDFGWLRSCSALWFICLPTKTVAWVPSPAEAQVYLFQPSQFWGQPRLIQMCQQSRHSSGVDLDSNKWSTEIFNNCMRCLGRKVDKEWNWAPHLMSWPKICEGLTHHMTMTVTYTGLPLLFIVIKNSCYV